MRDNDSFTAADIRKLFNLTRKTAEDWYSRGIYHASILCGKPGKGRLFAFGDLFAVHLARGLRNAGFSLETISNATTAFYEQPFEDGKCVLVIIGDEPSIVTIDEARTLVDRGVPVAAVNLLAAGKELSDEIDRQQAIVANAENN
ncbi:MAG: hypothetical protein KDA52_07725 [Planctomycetaceae bacterium]|nr:hypothetical protein [Planctomycetaceae bacterium]